MIEFFQRLFLGHAHKWEIVKEGRFVDDGRICGYYYIMKCPHCGKIKQEKL